MPFPRSPLARWLRVFTPRPNARVRLVCFPHAGASAGAFREWSALLPSSIELVAVQYPGRQDRVHETAVSDLATLADEIVGAVDPLFDRPVAFFGHSLGATVAFEVTRRLQPRFPTPLARLFVSARKAPADSRPSGRDYRTDEAMKAYLRRIGGDTEQLLHDEELWQLTVPALRSDLLMAEGYRFASGAPLTCPITAIAAEADRACPPSDLRRWADYTIGDFDETTLPGDHYYLTAPPVRLFDLIGEKMLPALDRNTA